MIRRSMIVLLLITLFRGDFAFAADAESEALHKAISQAAEKFEKAFAARDAKQIASLFTKEAEYVDNGGTVFHGRDAIEAEYAATFEHDPPGTIALQLISIRPVAAGVAVEDGIATFKPKEGDAVSQTCYTVTHVRQKDGSWLMASVRELEAARLSPHDRLQALAWLIGDWHEDVAGGAISSKWAWSKDGNFLIGELSVEHAGKTAGEATHRIGWDAERKQFRSWIFDAAGGSLEGWWRANEDGSWSVSLSGVDADGARSSSLMSYLPDGKDAIAVSQEQRVRDGDSLPGSTHRIVRRPPDRQAAAKEKK